jgi:multiple sugar transport system permease protein
VALYTPLTIWAFVILFPLYWVLITSFKLPIDTYQHARILPFIDFNPTLRAWADVLGGSVEVGLPLTNSIVAASISSVLATGIGGMAAFGLARFRYRFGRIGNRQIALAIIAQRMVPPAAILIAFFVVFARVGMQDSIVSLTIAHLGMNLPFAIWIMRDFFNQIPRELEEAARVDGATWWGAFWRITIPLAAPGLASTLIILFIFSWNEYFFASMLTLQDASTLPILIANQVTTSGVRWWLMSVLTLIAIVPTIILGFFVQRFVVRGLTAGAVK